MTELYVFLATYTATTAGCLVWWLCEIWHRQGADDRKQMQHLRAVIRMRRRELARKREVRRILRAHGVDPLGQRRRAELNEALLEESMQGAWAHICGKPPHKVLR